MKLIFTSFAFCLLLPFSSLAQWHQYCYIDTAYTPIMTSVNVDVQSNDDLSPPSTVLNWTGAPVTCDYDYIYGAFTSQLGGTTALLNNDSITYTPPMSLSDGWDHFYYGICQLGTQYALDTARAYVYVYSGLSTPDPSKLPGVTLYPNPVHNTLKLIGPAEQFIERVSVLDISGKRVLNSQPWKGALNIQNLPAGLYLLELEGEGAKNYIRFRKDQSN